MSEEGSKEEIIQLSEYNKLKWKEKDNAIKHLRELSKYAYNYYKDIILPKHTKYQPSEEEKLKIKTFLDKINDSHFKAIFYIITKNIEGFLKAVEEHKTTNKTYTKLELLNFALMSGDTDSAKKLLEEVSNTDEYDSYDLKPIHYATISGKDALEFLLNLKRKELNINATTINGDLTALDLSVMMHGVAKDALKKHHGERTYTLPREFEGFIEGALKGLVYTSANENKMKNEEFFPLLYKAISGFDSVESGGKIGSLISILGLDETIDKIKKLVD